MRFISCFSRVAAFTPTSFLLFLLVSTSFADDEKTVADVADAVTESTCTIYVAESTIPNAGFGVYTTKAFKKGDVIIEADSPSIIIADIDKYQPDAEEPEWQHVNYLWMAYGQGSFEARSTHESVLTFGSIPNFHPALKSAGPSGFERYDDTMFDRFKDPGAGAVSYHMGHDFVAKYRDVEANEEIFVDYGEHWLDGRDSEGFDKVPRAQEFENAEAVIGLLVQTMRETASDMAEPMLHLARGVLELYANNRTLSLIPDTSSELLDLDLASNYFLARSKLPRRSEEWIRTNGRCIDNIAPGRSTLRQAGMGGFAKRLLKKGSVIVPAPVLLIANSDILNMDEDQPDENLLGRFAQYIGKPKKNAGRKQLLLNYCLGHGDSKVLFCPQSNAALVNHCSVRIPCGEKGPNEGPNAAFRWATDWDKSTAATLKLSLEELSKQTSRGLTLELYALRDVLPGEEIFLDYGEEWEKAWMDHVDRWEPPKGGGGFSSYQGVADINDRREDSFIRTISEEKANPLPANIMTGCIYWETDDDFEWIESIDEDDIEDWKLYDDETILETFGQSGNNFTGTAIGKEFAEYWPCAIYMKDEANRTAVVRIFQTPGNDETDWASQGIPRFLTDYPMSSIMLFHGPYKSDQHLPNAFRHHVGLHDDLFPEQWKMHANAAAPVCNDDDAETCSTSL